MIQLANYLPNYTKRNIKWRHEIEINTVRTCSSREKEEEIALTTRGIDRTIHTQEELPRRRERPS
jgi:hypothetical protein